MIDWQALQADYESGKFSQSALERKYAVSRRAICKHAQKEQWVTPTRPRSQVPGPTNFTPKKEPVTQEKQAAFLAAYGQTAIIRDAAQAAGIARQTVYEWQEHDVAFSLAFNQAKEDAKDVIRAEIYRRAHDGWEESLVSAGKLLGTVRKYSDTLLIFHAKALMPEYRDKQAVVNVVLPKEYVGFDPSKEGSEP